MSDCRLLCPLEASMRQVAATTFQMRQFNRQQLVLSRAAKGRLAWFDWHRAHGENVSLTCRHFAIARTTYYRWQRRYNPWDLTTLEDRPSVPHRRRQRSWTTAQVVAVLELRKRYVRWGKEKLKRLLARAGLVLSVSKVGRILTYLKQRGQLVEPRRRSLARRRSWVRQYAVRKPKGYVVAAPGDLIQVDTMDVRPESGVVLKQFTVVDVVSRWTAPMLAQDATAASAKRALLGAMERMPFPIRAVQVDGGSEFMAQFEQACSDLDIRLFVLPPRSPKLNGCVERTNRTYREEFYECSTAAPTVAGLGHALRRWETTYNTVRPHQALAYLTPAEFLTNHQPKGDL